MIRPLQVKSRFIALFLAMHRWSFRFVIQVAFLFLTVVLVHAGPPSDSGVFLDDKEISTPATQSMLLEDVSLDYTYVGDAHLKSGAGGNLGEQTTQFGYRVKAPLTEQLSLDFGLNYRRFDFGQPTEAPLPYNLQTLSTSIGVDYRLSKDWDLFASVMPRLEMVDGWNSIESQDFQLGGTLGAVYEPNPDFSLHFGLALNPGTTGVPVMPILGLRWHFAAAWTLDFGFPHTSVEYQVLPKLRLSPVTISFEGGSFHTDKTYGSSVGDPNLNDRSLNYREIRLGTGADYAITKTVHVGLTAGAVVYREFTFNDANDNPRVAPAPYISASIKCGF